MTKHVMTGPPAPAPPLRQPVQAPSLPRSDLAPATHFHPQSPSITFTFANIPKHHSLHLSYILFAHSFWEVIMKYTTVVAAAALLGSASAKVHRMKLQKIPLSEQLVSSRHCLSCLRRVIYGHS